MNRERNFIVGLRLGSANISSVLLDVKGNIVAESKESADAQAGVDVILNQLFGIVRKMLDEKEIELERIAGIGIAAPGALDAHSGVCLYAPHHPK